MKNIFDKHAPITSKRTKSKPSEWITKKIKTSMNERDRFLRKARKSNKSSDWENYRKLRNQCNIMLRKSKATFTRDLINDNTHNPKSFWKIIKDIFPTKSKSQKDFSHDKTSNRTRAEDFKFYFSSIVSNLKNASFTLKNCIWKPTPTIPKRTCKVFKFKYVSILLIKNFLKKLKKTKATGVDELPAILLRDCADYIATPLHSIINQSLSTNTVPLTWKIAKIVPVYKSGDTSNVENYRPISVLPILSKMLEKAVHSQLIDFLENNNLLNSFQFGYRQNRSTDIATTLFVDEIRNNGDMGKLTGALFLDLSKAFDTISHGLILKKLESYGITAKELNWFTDYLFFRKQIVKIGTEKSSAFELLSGVPQGSILGPLLFLIFFNDFPEQLQWSKCIQYADDTVVYFSDRNAEEIESILNREIKNIQNYCYENELILNLKRGKTETMLFGTAKRLAKKNTIQLQINERPINHTESYCYLGNQLDPTLNLNNNFEKAYKRASGRVNLLRKMRPYLNTDAAYKIYEMVIVPILLYSTFLHIQTTATQQRKLSSLERRAKDIIGGNRKVCSIETRKKTRISKMVKRCINGDVCSNFKDYFVINSHELNTRNKNNLLKLPKVKLEFGRKSFKFQGAKVFNELPLSLRISQKF